MGFHRFFFYGGILVQLNFLKARTWPSYLAFQAGNYLGFRWVFPMFVSYRLGCFELSVPYFWPRVPDCCTAKVFGLPSPPIFPFFIPLLFCLFFLVWAGLFIKTHWPSVPAISQLLYSFPPCSAAFMYVTKGGVDIWRSMNTFGFQGIRMIWTPLPPQAILTSSVRVVGLLATRGFHFQGYWKNFFQGGVGLQVFRHAFTYFWCESSILF